VVRGPAVAGDLPGLVRADQERFVRELGWSVMQRLKNQGWGRIFPTGGNLLVQPPRGHAGVALGEQSAALRSKT
jgi:hypothetical protein